MKRANDKIAGGDAEIDREIRAEIGARIADLRRKRRLSARLVGEKLGVSREAITHIENGRNNITATTLWKLAILFRCNVEVFFPAIPDGFGLTKVDAEKIAQEGGERAAKWAAKLFGDNSQGK
jgi:transcriptional regulator with XRE-family HTH domain